MAPKSEKDIFESEYNEIFTDVDIDYKDAYNIKVGNGEEENK